jgi:hypothetical protein
MMARDDQTALARRYVEQALATSRDFGYAAAVPEDDVQKAVRQAALAFRKLALAVTAKEKRTLGGG